MQLFSQKKDIINFLNKYEIKHYRLIEDNQYGYVVNVDDDVKLYSSELTSISVKFNIVEGSFFCFKNQLTTLYGSPHTVHEDFWCGRNLLTSLIHSPQKVGGEYDCSSNNLLSLDGCPQDIIYTFNCSNNKLTNLVGGPTEIGDYFSCTNNELTSLKGIAHRILGDVYLYNNKLTTLNIQELPLYMQPEHRINLKENCFPQSFLDLNLEFLSLDELKKSLLVLDEKEKLNTKIIDEKSDKKIHKI